MSEFNQISWSEQEPGTNVYLGVANSKVFTARLVRQMRDKPDGRWHLEVSTSADHRPDTVVWVDSLDDAKVAANEYLAHPDERDAFDRTWRSYRQERGTSTPWGRAQSSVAYARGVIFYSTAGHGGFHVAPGVLETFPDQLKNPGGWYEEDVEWAKVALVMPEFFTRYEHRFALATAREYFPEILQTIKGAMTDKDAPAPRM